MRSNIFQTAVVLVILIGVAIAVWFQSQRPSAQPVVNEVEFEPPLLAGKCTAVSDGDTLTIVADDKEYRIRVAGIDCPEQEQPFSAEARQLTSEFCFEKPLQVRVTDVDRHGRQVGSVTVEGQDLGRELLRAGLVWHFKHYYSNPELAALEDEARSK